MTNESAKELLQFQARKQTGYLFKRLLGVIEDLREKHTFMLQKLNSELPDEYKPIIRASNYLDDNGYAFCRKQVLDAGNDAIRGLEEQINKFSISLD